MWLSTFRWTNGEPWRGPRPPTSPPLPLGLHQPPTCTRAPARPGHVTPHPAAQRFRPPWPRGSAPSEAAGTGPGKPPAPPSLRPPSKREPAAPSYEAQSRKGPTWQEHSPARPSVTPPPSPPRLTSPGAQDFRGPQHLHPPAPQQHLPSLPSSFLRIPTPLSPLPMDSTPFRRPGPGGACALKAGSGRKPGGTPSRIPTT